MIRTITRNYFVGLICVLVGAGLLTIAAIVGLTAVIIFAVLAILAYIYFGVVYWFKRIRGKKVKRRK